MGTQVACVCAHGGATAPVKALLETNELILRGGVRGRFAFCDMVDVRVQDGALRFGAGADTYALDLGEEQAVRWVRKILAPPPALAAKLGIGPAKRAQVIGTITDPVLAASLAGCTAADGGAAVASVAMVADEAALRLALQVHAETLAQGHLWVVHGKGRQARFGENAVRAVMRAAGYMDNKVAAVSAQWSATRYRVI